MQDIASDVEKICRKERETLFFVNSQSLPGFKPNYQLKAESLKHALLAIPQIISEPSE